MLRRILQETYELIDAKYYASNDYINSHLTAFGGTTCFLPYVVQYDDEVYFKFNSKPTHCLVGIGTSFKSSLILEFNTNQTKIHRSYLTGGTYNKNVLETDIDSLLCLKCVNLSSSEDKVELYFDGTYYDYWRNQLRNDNNTLRIDKFSNDTYDIEVYVL